MSFSIEFVDRNTPVFEWAVPIKIEQHSPDRLILQVNQPMQPHIFTTGLVLWMSYAGLSSLSSVQLDQIQVWAGLLAIIIALGFASQFLLLVTQTTTCTFDKSLDSLIVKQRNLFRVNTLSYSLSEIVNAQVEKADDYPAYRLQLSRFDDEPIYIPQFYSYELESKEAAIATIQTFLNPLETEFLA